MTEKEEKQRTILQNKSLHLFFRNLADHLNSKGLDQRTVLKESIEIPWDEKSIKNQIWRPLQIALLEKESTTELATYEIDIILGYLNKHFAEKWQVQEDFPSIETIMNKMRDNEN